MKIRHVVLAPAFAVALSFNGAFAANTDIVRDRVDVVMASWPDDVRANAERLIRRYGVPDRVTDTALVWDTPDHNTQQAMVDTVARDVNRSEAGGADMAPP